MNPSQRLADLAAEVALRRRGNVVVGLVAAGIALATYAYGGLGVAWLGAPLVLLATLLGVAAVAWSAPPLPRLPLAAVGAVAAVAAAQLLPLPQGFASLVSPARAEAQRAYADDPESAVPLSYAPLETRRALAHLLLGAAAFAAVAGVVRGDENVTLALAALFGLGIAEALVALFQLAAGARGVYGDPALGAGPWFGSFLNHSNFSQQMNVALGAGVGLLLVRESAHRHEVGARGRGAARTTFLQREAGVVCGLAVLALAIALSLSRGGLVGAVAGGAALAAALGAERRLGARAWALVAAPLVAFGLLALTGFDEVYERLGTLGERAAYTDRGLLTLSTLRAGADHWLVGAGLGAHRFAFPPYDATGSSLLAEQADNDFAQLFEETGLVGVAAVAVFLAAVAAAGLRAVRGAGPARYAPYGALYALVACAVQSFTDYGQRLPAVFLMTSALCGVVVSVEPRAVTRATPRGSSLTPRLGGVAVVVAIGLWLGLQAWGDYRAERWRALALAAEERLRAADWQGKDTEWADLLAASEAAAAARPTDVELAYWLSAYRWQAFTGGADASALLATAEGREVGERLAGDLAAARRLSPTFGPAATLEGQVRLALGELAEGTRLVRQGVRLAPYDPEACFAAATAAALADPPDREAAAAMLRRAVELEGSYFAPAAELWVAVFGDPGLPRELAGEDLDRLGALAELLAATPATAAAAAEVRAEAEAALAARVAAGQASPGQVALQAARDGAAGRIDEALRLYRAALAAAPTNIAWRLALCDLLEGAGRFEEAFREARLALRTRPGSRPARERLERLSLQVGGDPAPGVRD